jgi:hypothetical protein
MFRSNVSHFVFLLPKMLNRYAAIGSLLLLLLPVLISAVAGKKNLPDQYHASCFPGCRCNKTTVECRNLHETSTELFRHILPEIYPQLDTLVVTGNSFGVMEDEDIFGSNNRHSLLTLVNISNNGITSFGAQTFIGIPRVEYFYLSHNRIESVGDSPFSYFTSLKLIDLTDIFGKHISVHARADLIRRMFRSEHSFVDLQEVILPSNQLDRLHSDTFCNVKGLMRLNLADNLLTAFDFDPQCLESLHVLDLRGNQLTTIPQTLWKGLPSLDTMDFSRNPLNCDCELQPFHEFARSETNSFLDQEHTTCAAPSAFSGKNLISVESNFCRRGGGFFHWFLLLIAAVALLLNYRWLRKNRSRIKLPFVAGYSQLKSSDEYAQPAFV